MFTVEERDHTLDKILKMARSLFRSLECIVNCLLQNSEAVQEIASRLEESLRELPLPFEQL